MKVSNMTMSKFVFFWNGPFSQWAKSKFVVDGVEFNTCEQYMMYKKAMLFNDTDTADAIMKTSDPRTQKSLGRQVKNFDDAVWMEHAFDYVVAGNRAKFSQNSQLNKALAETKGKVLVEASPYDKRWGIGMMEGDAGIEDPKNWRGENLLGYAITQVRLELFGE